MVVNQYSNTTGGDQRELTGGTGRAVISIQVDTGDTLPQVTQVIGNFKKTHSDSSGDLHAGVWDDTGAFLTEIGSSVALSTLSTTSFTELTFNASASQQTASQPTNDYPYVGFYIDNAGTNPKSDVEMHNISPPIQNYNALPYQAQSTSPTTFAIMDTTPYRYFKGSVTYVATSPSSTANLLPPPYVNIGLHGL